MQDLSCKKRSAMPSSCQRWPESLFQTSTPLLFQNVWNRIGVQNFFQIENATPVQTPATIDKCQWFFLKNDHAGSCYGRNWKVNPDPSPVFQKKFWLRVRIQVRKKRESLPESTLTLRIRGHRCQLHVWYRKSCWTYCANGGIVGPTVYFGQLKLRIARILLIPHKGVCQLLWKSSREKLNRSWRKPSAIFVLAVVIQTNVSLCRNLQQIFEVCQRYPRMSYWPRKRTVRSFHRSFVASRDYDSDNRLLLAVKPLYFCSEVCYRISGTKS